MKTITINVSEPVYEEFKQYAQRHDRTTSELVREAMAAYCETRIRPGTRLRDLKPFHLGKIKRALNAGDDLLEEMIHG